MTYTVKREYLAAIIFGGFSNMTIWQRIDLAISNTAIYKDCNVIIWRQLILANFLNSPISPNKLSPIINHFTVDYNITTNTSNKYTMSVMYTSYSLPINVHTY